MIIADTGFWVGLFDSSDSNHNICKHFLVQCNETLVTTTPVLTETVHLLNQRRYQKVALNFLELLIQLQEKQLFLLFEVGAAQLPRQLDDLT